MQPLTLTLLEVIRGVLALTSLMELSLLCFAGHGMTAEGHPIIDHWGRRLMATPADNDTEEKNCSEPGTLHDHNVGELRVKEDSQPGC